MENEKDRYGDTMRLVEKAKEDIYFAEKERELIDKLKAKLKEVERRPGAAPLLTCPKCGGELATYSLLDVVLDRCRRCDGIWLDRGELETILKKVNRSPIALFVDRFISKGEEVR